MGIKGIYPELGPCKRISLSKLAGDCLESKKRPYRIAVDIAIWQFQNQAARGGANPAIRTLFYRLVRLLATPIQPIFVFDGPHKPAFKRNKRSSRGGGFATAMAKRLIRLFGFPVHDAPGEAEAECALLQRHGIVDAVLSEDVDTIMFGCTRTLRNWSAESKTGSTPTHVSLYDVDDMKLKDVGLDREGMVLVALMSGGDYLPDGIPGCGVKVACEAAKAGFGKSICRLRASDKTGIQAWRSRLIHELQTNEQNLFRTKHKKMTIPQDFPNLEVLGYYTHPVVSPASSLQDIRQKVGQKSDIQLEALREFTRETFSWDYRTGAVKFVRVLGQALLVQKMTDKADAAAQHIKRISGRRTHFSTDSTPELRVSYIPEEVVPIDMAHEEDEVIPHGRGALALNSDDEFETTGEAGVVEDTPKVFDVSKPDLAWVLEGLVKTSVPSAFQEWQDEQHAKAVRNSPTKKKNKAAKRKPGVSKTAKFSSSDMPRGALDQYVKTTKASSANQQGLSKKAAEPSPSPPPSPPPPPPPSPPPPPPPPPPLSSSPTRRPLARHSPSKQSSSSSSSSPTSKSLGKKKSALQTIDSSPSTHRSSHQVVQDQPEAIYISSSPPAAAPASFSPSSSSSSSSPPPSPSPVGPSSSSAAAPSLLSRPDKVPGPVRPTPQGHHRQVMKKAVPGTASRRRRDAPFLGDGPLPQKSSTTLKQSSMHMFVTKSRPCTASGSAEHGDVGHGDDDDDDDDDDENDHEHTVLDDAGGQDGDSDLEPLAALTRPASSSSTPPPTGETAAPPPSPPEAAAAATLAREHGGNMSDQVGSSPKKKRLFRPRTSAPGFYEEIELGGQERDAQLAEEAAAAAAAAGSRASRAGRASRASRAIRWSDVSVIDLT
ncbi:hypothetical protein E4U41_002808 [Claviceps citrina]|nr:hypothetical protein E4U41_002808 [Claviceps citrina]